MPSAFGADELYKLAKVNKMAVNLNFFELGLL